MPSDKALKRIIPIFGSFLNSKRSDREFPFIFMIIPHPVPDALLWQGTIQVVNLRSNTLR